VRLALALRGVSIAALSRATGVPANRLRSRIDGGKDFQVEELAAVCRYLEVPMHELIAKAGEAA